MNLNDFRGHGTISIDNNLYSTVSGIIQRVNKLLTVNPLKARFSGQIGDLVIGRVTEVIFIPLSIIFH